VRQPLRDGYAYPIIRPGSDPRKPVVACKLYSRPESSREREGDGHKIELTAGSFTPSEQVLGLRGLRCARRNAETASRGLGVAELVSAHFQIAECRNIRFFASACFVGPFILRFLWCASLCLSAKDRPSLTSKFAHMCCGGLK